MKRSEQHDHEAETQDRLRRDARMKMKRLATARPDISCKEVYEDALASTVVEFQNQHDREELGATLPTYNTVRSSIQRTRAKIRPPLPETAARSSLEAPWTKTKDGRPFLLFNDGVADRIIGFSTDEAMEIICQSSALFMDGTFRVVPTMFLQLYSVHASYKGVMMPLIYFLLPDKEKDTYKRMSRLIRDYASSRGFVFQPLKFHLDYEASAIMAIKETFPGAEMKVCNFHHNQALYRKVQRLGLKKAYEDDLTVRR